MRFVAIMVLLVGCGDSVESQPPRDGLEFVLNDTPIELEAPTSTLVQLLVVGANGDPVSVTSTNLPSFATLSDTTLHLAPGWQDAGDYAFDLVATTESETATGTMHVKVNRINTPPKWLPVPLFTSGNGDHAPYANVDAVVCDDEEDNFRFEINVVPAGSVLTNHADFVANVDFAVTPAVTYEPESYCVDIHVDFSGLATGDYITAIHAVDVLGAEDPYGWVPGWVNGGDGMTLHVTNGE